jgi:hypothetical protein
VIGSYTPESYYRSYIVATSGVNRLASQICFNRLIRKKFVRISVRISFIMSERMIDATSILARELEVPPV